MKVNLYTTRTTLLVSIVLILVMSTVSYAFSMFADAKEDVEQNITNFSRGTYDILIRPENARTYLEKQLNLVEENYLGIADGGITIEEWQEIKNHPAVEIAAPVASVGLFTARERTFMIEKSPTNMNYFELQYFTSDGIKSYAHVEESFMYDFGHEIEEWLFYASTGSVLENYTSFDDATIATFIYPKSYHQVVAVDPEEEGKLTEFDLTALTERGYDPYSYAEGVSIPIMSLGDVTVPVSIKVMIDGLSKPTQEEVKEWNSHFHNNNPIYAVYRTPEIYDQVINELISKKRLHEEKEFEFEAEESHSPFKQEFLYVDEEDSALKLADDSDNVGGTYFPFTHRLGYRLQPVVYEVNDDESLFVKQIGEDKEYGAPIYRDMEKIEFYEMDENNARPLNNSDFFDFVENGTFSIKENTLDLASAPLGIYGREGPRLASDPSKELHPSAVPGSFITTPAHGLVSIEHADKFNKGDTPIDAIRVKVAGITGYDRKAATLIENLAQEWEGKGFTVDIVAGASLQDLTVEVEGIGDVVQPFTTLGAAETIVSSWNAIQMGMTILYGLVALTFVGFTFFNLLSDRLKDEQLLAHIGWSQKLIRRLRYKEWGVMLGIPILVVVGGFISFGFWKGEWLPFILSIVVSIVFISLFFLGEWMKNRRHRQVQKQVRSVTVQNIRYYSGSLFAACVQLILMTILTCFLPFFLIQNVKMTTNTRLGAYVHGEIEGIFIIVIVLLYVLSLTTIYQTLNRMWERRKSEIQLFLYLGWETSTTRRYFVNEVIIWAGISIVIGWLVSLATTMMIVDVSLTTILLQVAGFIVILAITLVSSIFTLHRFQVKGGDAIENQAS